MQLHETVVAVLIPLGAFFMAVAIVALVGYFNHQERKQRHETIRLALEKGQTLPAELLAPARGSGNELARGIRTIFAGLGVAVLMWFLRPDRSLWAIGLLVILVGMGQLAAHAVTTRRPRGPTTGPTA